VEPDVNVEVHWACSEGLDQKDINDDSCSLRPWNFDGEHDGKHMTFTVDPGIYAGACQFSTLPDEKSPAGVTTPETSAQAATTPERTTPEPTTPEPTTPEPTTLEPTTTEQVTQAATTPEQPATSPTTTKNGAAGDSLRSWFTAVFLGLAVHYIY